MEIRELYTLPTMEEIVQNVSGSTILSIIDLRSDLHQKELDETFHRYTEFVTADCLYYYKRMMYGLSRVPEQYSQSFARVS